MNIAFQTLIASEVELCALHHQRKEGQQTGKPKRLADVYGSRWLTAGMGSVLRLWGEPGDLVVELRHLKQPAEELGPLSVRHDHAHGRSTLIEQADLETALSNARDGLLVKDAAELMFETVSPNRNEIEKARRRLESLVGRLPSDTTTPMDSPATSPPKRARDPVAPTVTPSRTSRVCHGLAYSSLTQGHAARALTHPLIERGAREDRGASVLHKPLAPLVLARQDSPVARLMLYGTRRAIPKTPDDARSHHPAAHCSRNSDRISDVVTLARDPIDLVADDEDGQEGEYSSDDAAELDHALSVGRLFGGYKGLDEPVAPTTLVLCEQHAAELREANGRIIEQAQNRFSIGDRESNEILLGVQRGEESIARP